MIERRALPAALAVAGFAAVVIGIHQGLVHVAPGYEGTIVTGWGGSLNHEERLLAGLGAVAIGGAVASLRWRRLAVVPVATGSVVLTSALRAVVNTFQDRGLYTETTTDGGNSVAFVLGAEPFLLVAGGLRLVAGGLLLVGAGVAGRRRHAGPTHGGVAPGRRRRSSGSTAA